MTGVDAQPFEMELIDQLGATGELAFAVAMKIQPDLGRLLLAVTRLCDSDATEMWVTEPGGDRRMEVWEIAAMRRRVEQGGEVGSGLTGVVIRAGPRFEQAPGAP
ncbi:MAG: hypothetical protein H6809_01100 [Phycisphaeraceae bacterium]|nr:hypothetical protein [Phycisphaeraceae bacterium]